MGFLKQRYAIGIFILVAIFMVLPVFNVEAGEIDNFLITVETDKEVYEVGETVEYLIKVKNISQNEAKDISIIDELPSNIKVINTDGQINGNKISWEKDELLPEEEVALHLSIMLNEVSVTPPVDGSDSNDDTIPSTEGGDGAYDDTVPPTEESTGDWDTPSKDDDNQLPSDISGSKPDTGYNNFIMLMMGIILSGLGYLLYKVKGKKIGKFFIFALLCSMASNADVNAESINVSQEYSHSVKINGESIESKILLTANMILDEAVKPEEMLVDVSLTLFLDEYQTLSDDVVHVKVGEETAYLSETSEKGFLKLQLPINSSVSITHPSIETIMTIAANGEVSVVNKKGEAVIGFIERTQDSFIKYRDNVVYFDSSEVETLITIDEEKQEVVLNTADSYSEGDIIIIPPTQQYPIGYTFKVISQTKKNNQTILKIVTPELYEVLEKLTFDTHALENESIFELEEGFILESGNFEVDDEEMVQRSVSRIDRITFPKKEIVENVTLQGSLILSSAADAKVDIDFPLFKLPEVNELKFEMKMSPQFNLKLTTKKLEEIKKFEKEVIIGKIIMPTTVPGITITVPLGVKVSASGGVSTNLNSYVNFEFGIQYNHHGWNVYPDDKFTMGSDLDEVKLSGSAKGGVTAAVNLNVFSIDILGVKSFGGAELTGGIGSTDLCANIKLGGFGEIGLTSKILPFLKDLKYYKSIQIGEFKFGNCNKPDLEVFPKNISMIPGEELYLRVMSNGMDITLDDDVSYKSENNNKLVVDDNGKVVAKSFGVGDVTNVTVTYKKNGILSEEIVPIYINPIESKGLLKGNVVDAVSDLPISGATVTIFDLNGNYLNKLNTTTQGDYQIYLSPGEYHIKTEKYGYDSELTKIKIVSGNTTTYEPKLRLISDENIGVGTVTGLVTSALTNKPLEGVRVDFYRGVNMTTGDLIHTLYTDEEGIYSGDLPSGNYTAVLQKEGYLDGLLSVLVVGDYILTQPTISLSPGGILAGDLRVVLNWGEHPRDLDAHLIGTKTENSDDYFHVNFRQLQYQDEKQLAILDIDDRNGYGPETITLSNKLVDGHYVYSVHDYTNRSDFESNPSPLSLSGATVYVYSDEQLVATFTVPSDSTGNLWRVFEIVDGVILPLNEMDYIDELSYNQFLPNRFKQDLYERMSLSTEIFFESKEDIVEPQLYN